MHNLPEPRTSKPARILAWLIQRTGSRGRIFYVLADEMLQALGIPYRAEPVFDAIPPNPWYAKFALEHGLTLRTDVLYNPGFFLEGTAFPNAEAGRVDTFYRELKMKGREDLVRKYERLKELKGIIL